MISMQYRRYLGTGIPNFLPTASCQGESVEGKPQGHLGQVVGVPAHRKEAARRETQAAHISWLQCCGSGLAPF